jgi:FkbM family methyltransferase
MRTYTKANLSVSLIGLLATVLWSLSHRFEEAVLYEASTEASRKAEEKNSLSRYRDRGLAVSNTVGAVNFSTTAPTGLTNKISTEPGGVTVDATTLDADLDDEFQSRLSFLEIDVKGAELQVLSGASKTLATAPNLLIMLERLKTSGLTEITELPKLQGYTVFAIFKGLPDQNPEKLKRAHDLFACKQSQFDSVCTRAKESLPKT